MTKAKTKRRQRVAMMGTGRIEVGDEVFSVALPPATATALARELRAAPLYGLDRIIRAGLSAIAARRRYEERKRLKPASRSSR